jgi:choline dehydrogenase
VRHELPGVGENLRDHYVPRTRWLVGKKGIIFNDRGAASAWRSRCCTTLFRQGMLAMTGAPIRAFGARARGWRHPT